MFPLPWNFPFRKKDGTIVNVVDAMGGGGGGSDLPDYDSSDVGKVLGVDANGDLEWSEAIEHLSESLDTLSDTVDGLDNSVDAVSNDVDVLVKNGAVNVLPISAKSQTINGVTFTVNDDCSVTIDGTATQTTEFPIIDKNIILKAGNYILSTKNNIPSNVYFSIYIVGKGWTHVTDDANSIEFSKDSDIEISICRFWIADGTTVADLTAYPMIADASYSGDYVPYAKTNLELTAENVPGFKDRVDILGAKNFLRNDAVSTTESGVTFTVRDDGTILVSGTATDDVLLTIRDDLYLPDGEYTMSLEPIDANQYAEIDVSIKSADNSEVLETFKLGNPQLFPTWEIEHTFTYSSTTAGKIIIVLKVWDTTVMQDAVIKPMIRLASDADMTYQPYSKTNQELTAENQTLTQKLSGNYVVSESVSLGTVHGDGVKTVDVLLNELNAIVLASIQALDNNEAVYDFALRMTGLGRLIEVNPSQLRNNTLQSIACNFMNNNGNNTAINLSSAQFDASASSLCTAKVDASGTVTFKKSSDYVLSSSEYVQITAVKVVAL